MSPDFWATLIAGVIGFAGAIAGVMIQRYFEQKDRQKEEERQRVEIARALLFEIVGFYVNFVRDLRKRISGVPFDKSDPRTLVSPPTSSFPIYRANAHRIGEFHRNEIAAVIRFYTFAESFLSTLRSSVETQIQLWTHPQDPFVIQAAVQNVSKLQSMLPTVEELVSDTASALSKRAKVTFDPDTFTIRPDDTAS
jgi:hypothetical protein